MLENSIYSVISPEGCASILWKDKTKVAEAAATLHLTARDLLELGVIDEIIPEPPGGAHQNYDETAANFKVCVQKHLAQLKAEMISTTIAKRYKKFRQMGKLIENCSRGDS
jgi:acetyl-CoA carboxylase carboxyl transferase subunit alpha